MLQSKISSKKVAKSVKVVLICLLVTAKSAFAHSSEDIVKQSTHLNETCGSDELNHGILVECNVSSRCQSSTGLEIGDDIAAIWPTSLDEVMHVYSTHSGKRLVRTSLKNLNYLVDDHMKLFDINTTLTIRRESISSGKDEGSQLEIFGLGGTLEAKRIALAIEDDSLERIFGSIFGAMFAVPSFGAHLKLLRLTLEIDFIREHSLVSVLQEIDKQVARNRKQATLVNQDKLKIVVDLKRLTKSRNKDVVELAELLAALNAHLAYSEIWALALDLEDLKSKAVMMPSTVYNLFASVPLEQAPDFVDWLKLEGRELNVKGLLVKSQYSVAYDALKYLQNQHELIILTVGRPRSRTKYLGDWLNAQEYAIEALNYLKYGSRGFIEDISVIELDGPAGSSNSEAPIYNLAKSHNTHFKSPMFYATCHLSRYLSASLPIDYKLFTQPNMFSAHYSAFVTSDRQYIVSVVLNGNEHMLPFSWVIDDKVVANAGLESKSFNTFIKKIK